MRTPPSKNMTPRRLAVLQSIERFWDRHNMSPTLQEIAKDVGVSKVTVHEHVEALRGMGHIALGEGRFRSMRSTRQSAPPSGRRLLEDGVSILALVNKHNVPTSTARLELRAERARRALRGEDPYPDASGETTVFDDVLKVLIEAAR